MIESLLRDISYKTLLELSTEEGINASSKDEVFGCIFGRDSALTILKILKVHQKSPHPKLLEICRRALLSLIILQGEVVNIESGEEPGKFIHEFRKKNYEHLIKRERPWFLYSDGYLRNYDSLDSTPLVLIAIYRYWEVTGDQQFLLEVLSAVEKGLNWMIGYGDLDNDLLVEYQFPPERKFGGLVVQSWTDSRESVTGESGKMPKYPIAPVEVQGYIWLSYKLWSDYYQNSSPKFSDKLAAEARALKKKFNEKFIFKNHNLTFAAQALDGDKNQIQTVTANPLLLLWASYAKDGKMESIAESEYIPDFAKRAFEDDLFDSSAGIRTMSKQSATFNPNQDSYHNGSFWPVLNGLIYEGLLNWGFNREADQLREAALKPIFFFMTPIELYIKSENGEYLEYQSKSGQRSCKKQAWSAAAALDLLTP